jgi:hypothetical protein
VDLIVVDDSKRPDKAVARPGMGPLVAVGGMCVPSAAIRPLTLGLEQMCDEYGFPANEEFKWSPPKDSWMRKNLRGGTRAEFHVDCLRAAAHHDARACVVIEDEGRRSTSGRSDDHELDAVKLFLERCHSHLEDTGSEAIVLADHPSGGRPAEAEFVAACLRTLRRGTGYVMPTRIALVLTEDSKNTRLLQLADLIVGATLAYVAGETRYSPTLFENHILGLMRRSADGRVGGFGLKLYPDRRYLNLYHWLLGDADFYKYGIPHPMPKASHPYVNAPLDPREAKVRPRRLLPLPARAGRRRASR